MSHNDNSKKKPKILYWILKTTGIGHVTRKRSGIHFWKITGKNKLTPFITLILPYSKVKKDQLQVALKLVKLIGKSSQLISDKNVSKRLKLCKRLKELKK